MSQWGLAMDPEPRLRLSEFVERFGESLLTDAPRLRALLLDACPGARAEISLLVAAVEEGVPERLARGSGSALLADHVTHAVEQLEAERGLSQSAARWAVESWAWALQLGPAPSDDVAPPVVPSGPTPADVEADAVTKPIPVTPPPPPPPPHRQERSKSSSPMRALLVIAVLLAALGGGVAAAVMVGSGDDPGPDPSPSAFISPSTDPVTTPAIETTTPEEPTTSEPETTQPADDVTFVVRDQLGPGQSSADLTIQVGASDLLELSIDLTSPTDTVSFTTDEEGTYDFSVSGQWTGLDSFGNEGTFPVDGTGSFDVFDGGSYLLFYDENGNVEMRQD
jgi:hypothetical protein